MKKILGLSLVAIMALTSNVSAEETATDAAKFNITGNAAITSHYMWRGWTYSNQTPTGQAGIDFNNIADVEGVYAGIWGSGIAVGSEVDLYAGYSGALSSDMSYDIGFIHYWYTLAGGSYGEAYLGLTYGDYSLKVYKEATSLLDGITPVFDASFGPIDVEAGYYVKSTGSAFFGSVGVNWECMLDKSYNMNAMIAYNSADTANKNLFGYANGVGVALTMSKDF